jgi:Dolichyl-phosphate-mannose-protein mannosyltransferase
VARRSRLPLTAIVGVSVLAVLTVVAPTPSRAPAPAGPAPGPAPAPGAGGPPVPGAQRGRRVAALVAWLPLAAIVAAGLLVRLWHLDSLGYNSDEAVYGGQGAALAHDPTLSPFFPTFRAHPLLFQMLLSVGYHLGIGEIFGRLAAVALGVLTILVVARLGTVLYDRRAGLLAALVIALMPYHVVVTRQVLLDGPMVLGATITLLAVARFAATQRPEWLLAAGAALGVTGLTKETSLVLAGSVYAFLAVSPELKVRGRTVLLAAGAMLAVFALYPLSLQLAGAQRTGGNYLAWQLLRRPNHDYVFYPSTVPEAMGWAVVAFAALGLVLLRHRITWREKLLVCWIAVPVAFFELWPVKGFQYLLPTAPAVALLAAHAVLHAEHARLPGRLGRRAAPLLAHPRFVPLAAGIIAASLLVTTWERITPTAGGTFLAGSGGVPGGRETGRWIAAHAPLNARILTIGPSMANILAYYGHREASGISVSPNPLNRNPSYEAVRNPDLLLRRHEVQYVVWDAFSAGRSKYFSQRLLRYVDRYHGRVVASATIPARTPGGHAVREPIITVYAVRP